MTAELNRYGGSSTVTVVFLVGSKSLGVFFFFFDRNMAQRVFRNVCGFVEKKTLKTFGACAGY